MFYDKEKIATRIETLIGEHCVVNGSLSGNGLLKVDGNIEGDINWQDDLEIAETCNCNGNIICINAYISGKVVGNIVCQGTLTIESTGIVNGDINAKNLKINDGGILDGTCTMKVNKNVLDLML